MHTYANTQRILCLFSSSSRGICMFASESASKQVYSKAFFHIHIERHRQIQMQPHCIRFHGSSLFKKKHGCNKGFLKCTTDQIDRKIDRWVVAYKTIDPDDKIKERWISQGKCLYGIGIVILLITVIIQHYFCLQLLNPILMESVLLSL